MPAPLLLLLTVLLGAPLSARADDLMVLLETRSCPNCKLTDAALVHADLRDANLNAADLRRANLSRAHLDGADLRDADLRFSSLKGASLRGADLRGAQLDGTDLRQTDLSGSMINPGELDRSHWLGSIGISQGHRSSASLHNAGVDEAQAGRWLQAERLFGQAIQADPDQPMSWIARGLCRGNLGHFSIAAEDILHGADLLERNGTPEHGKQLRQAVSDLQSRNGDRSHTGNGLGLSLLEGTFLTLEALIPMTLKTLIH